MRTLRMPATLVSVALLMVAVAAFASPGPAAAAATPCGNKSVKIPIEGQKASHYPVKAIEVEGGVTCAEAVSVIGQVLGGKPPAGWRSVTPHFELPTKLAAEGLFPQLEKNGAKKIKYAIHGA